MNKTVQENIVKLWEQGYTKDEISNILRISKHTVKAVVTLAAKDKSHNNLDYLIGYYKDRNET